MNHYILVVGREIATEASYFVKARNKSEARQLYARGERTVLASGDLRTAREYVAEILQVPTLKVIQPTPARNTPRAPKRKRESRSD
jgi:hypothetical protein